jgi:hypothetical protein
MGGKFTDDDLKQIEGTTRNLSAKFKNGMGEKVLLMKWAATWHAKPTTPEAVEKKPH